MRETKKLQTPNGTEIEVYSFITGKDQREYQGVLYSALKLKAEGLQLGSDQVAPSITEIPAGILLDLDKKLIELLVVSVNGKKENIFSEIENMPAPDYDFIVGELRGFFRTE